MTREKFIAAIKAAGIVGEGGAGFPAHVKYTTPEGGIDTVIANGCECEPLLHTDQHIMETEGQGVLAGLSALASAVGAKRAVLGIKRKHGKLIGALTKIAAPLHVEIFPLDDFYPAGDEQVLVREITGRSVPPLGIPLAVKTIVANVSTLARVHAALSSGVPVTRKILTVTGEVGSPSVIDVPIGTSLAECLAFCGGARVAEPVFVIGGPMMGRVVETPGDLEKERVTKTTGGLIVLPSGHHLHKNAVTPLDFMRRRAASACIQCRMCSELCPRTLIGHPFETHRVMRAFANGREAEADAAAVGGSLAAMCCECGICEQYACPMGLSPRRINQGVKAAMRKANTRYEGPRGIVAGNTAWREYRKILVPRLAARIGIERYMHVATPFGGEFIPQSVEIPLRQHIGAPAEAVVKPGDTVRSGDLVGEIPAHAPAGLGARVHASVNGVVEAVTDRVRIRVR